MIHCVITEIHLTGEVQLSSKGIWRSKQFVQSTTVKCKSIFCGSHFLYTIKMASRIIYTLVENLTGDESVFETKNKT